MVREHYGKVTDAMLAEVRERMGQTVASKDPPYWREVSEDGIRLWAAAIGDRNPLFGDAEYAAQTRWGGMIAPPTMLSAFDKLTIGYRGGLPGIHSFFGGTDWHFRRPVRVGERIDVQVVFKDLIEMPSRFAGRMFKQLSDLTFTNQQGETVATAIPWGFRTERATAAEKGKYKALELASYTADELAAIVAHYQREEIRGATPRYWEDVSVGDELAEILKGPWTATNVIAFYQAYGGWFIMAHGYWYDYLKRHPKAGIPNAQGIPEPPALAHWDTPFARSVGVPGAYDYGPERIAWLGNLVTNWMGDDGFLKRLYVEVRRFNLIGDTAWCRGRVTGKEVDGGEARVECEVEAVDQRGETTAKGIAVVVLPRRDRRATG